ncbi:MAG TPA: DUF3179 domain-containing protein, partial [Anaerolineae bacterium]|nr:DUF3179 domain-containing protein [Anaerolineae bacterium]
FPGLLLLLAGCAGATTAVPPTPTSLAVIAEVADTAVPPTAEEATAAPAPTMLPADTAVPPEPVTAAPIITAAPIPATPGQNRRIADDTVYNFPQLLPFDGIRPVYNPEFAPADEAPLSDDELVMGVAWGGEAKAYPVTVMRSREMVNDELAGIPTLVTW